MTLPPPPEPFGSQPPAGGGQSGGGVPPQWGPQQGYGGYGPPPQGQWGPGGPPQGPWGPAGPGGPGGQPPKGGKSKWILGGVAVVLAIALAVVITVLVVRPSDGGGGNGSDPTAQNGNSEFASANDTGPVNIITEDPTCAAWGRVSREYTASIEGVDWKNRAKALPATAWTPEQRDTFESASKSLQKAVQDSHALTRETPNRLMRELYMQFDAYSSAYITRIPTYQPDDENLVAVANTLVSVISSICSAIRYESAPAVASLVESVAPSLDVPSPSIAEPSMSINGGEEACQAIPEVVATYNAGIAEWQTIDPSVPVKDWTAEQKSIVERVKPVMEDAANRFQSVGNESDSFVFQELALLTSQYLRAYVASLPSYSSADNYLVRAGNYLGGSLEAACMVTDG